MKCVCATLPFLKVAVYQAPDVGATVSRSDVSLGMQLPSSMVWSSSSSSLMHALHMLVSTLHYMLHHIFTSLYSGVIVTMRYYAFSAAVLVHTAAIPFAHTPNLHVRSTCNTL